MSEVVGIREDQRNLATYVCGNPGSGKSSLLQRMILRDIYDDRGVCVIDPTSQLIKTVIEYLPQEHLDRVVYFSTNHPIPLDFFSAKDDDEKQELLADLSNIIDLSTAPIAKNYLRKVIATFFEANENLKKKNDDRRLTLFDIPRFILGKEFRESVLSHCAPERRFDHPDSIKLQSDSITAIVMRLSQITDSLMMQRVLGARKGLDVSKLIDENKILLVDLKETENDQIIGSIIAAKIQHAIFARRNLKDLYACRPYYLYIDECDVILKFAASRFAAILGRARKYKLCMTMANPIPSDLPPEIQDGLGKIGNLVLFNLDEADARIFKAKLLPSTPGSLVNLPPFNAIFRTDNKVFRIQTPSFLLAKDNDNAEYVRNRTLHEYPCETSRDEYSSEHEVRGGQPTPATGVPVSHGRADGPPPRGGAKAVRPYRAGKPEPPVSKGKG